MKTQILSFVMAIAMLSIATVSNATIKNDNENAAKEKIVKDFTAQYATMPDITISGDGYIASSIVDGREVSSGYNKRGNKLYSIVRYKANALDREVLNVVKDKYNNYYIPAMEKVTKPGQEPVFVVHLTNDKSVKTLNVHGDNVLLVRNYKKI